MVAPGAALVIAGVIERHGSAAEPQVTLSLPLFATTIVPACAELVGCGGSFTTGQDPQSGHQVDMKAMLSKAEAQAK